MSKMGKKTLDTVGCVTLILLAGGISHQGGWFAACFQPTTNPTPTPTPTGFQPPDGKCYIGAWLDSQGYSYDVLKQTVTEWKQKTGKGVFILGIWGGGLDRISEKRGRFLSVRRLYEDGIIGAIAYNVAPRTDARGGSQSDTITVREVVDGVWDNELRLLAEIIKEYVNDIPFFFEFGSEFNGQWTGYGSDAGTFVQAWRRVHDIFSQEGVEVEWVFQPNNQPPGQYPQWFPNRKPWKEYYPGDAYVDWIAVSWHSYSTYSMGKDKTIDQWFNEGEYLKFAAEHNKPFMFAETGQDHVLDSEYAVPLDYKIMFINQLFDFMTRNNRIKAFIWYDLPYTMSIPELLNAYRQGITDPRYIYTLDTADGPQVTLGASPNNSNIFRVTGNGFSTSETVWLRLVAGETTVFNFTETIETDEQGSFSTIVIVPTSIHGTFNLTASTSSVSVYTEYNVPDLTGPTGPTGPKGDPADPMIGNGGIGLGIVAIVLAVYALAKKSSNKK